jgi:iron complex outermembrane recepter protein
VFGSAGAGTGGERAYKAAYFEALIPILSTLNLTVAGRYDDYNDFGNKFSPRVSLEFRPLDTLLVRGSWGRGFRAPTLNDLYGADSTTNLNSPPNSSLNPPHAGGDELACAALTAERAASGNATYQPYPVDPCTSTNQYQWLLTANPNLQAEESRNWGVGVVFSPTDTLSVALDYWDVKLENIIGAVPRALAFRLGDQGAPNYGVTRTPGFTAPGGTAMPGAPQQILLPIDNGAERRARGLDLDVNYSINTAAAGTFRTNLAATRQLQYDFTPIGAATLEQAGTAGAPKTRAQLTLGWDYADFGFALITNYIASSSNANPAQSLPAWTTFDAQANWSTPWNGKVSLGMRNIADKDPPFNNLLFGFPFYSNSLYNIYGRTPYMRYEQRF